MAEIVLNFKLGDTIYTRKILSEQMKEIIENSNKNVIQQYVLRSVKEFCLDNNVDLKLPEYNRIKTEVSDKFYEHKVMTFNIIVEGDLMKVVDTF